MSRQRMTWEKDGGDQRVLPVERAASAHPAYPDEGPASPAYEPDPDADKYENGDTSSWAEDPTTGPYPDSAHPATPDEGPASPAYRSEGELPPNEGDQVTNEDLGVSKAAAEEIKLATEKKAAKCIRIATPLLAHLTRDADIIEDQALDLMGLSDDAIHSTLNRLAQLRRDAESEEKKEKDEAKGEEEAAETVQEEAEEKAEKKDKADKKADDELLRKLLAEEGMIAGDDGESKGDESKTHLDYEDDDKKASSDVLANIQQSLAALAEQVAGLTSGPVAEEVVEEVDEDEAMLEAMLQEEGMEEEAEDDVEAMLYSMLHEEGMDDEAGDDCVGCDQMAEDEVVEEEVVETAMDDEAMDEAVLDIDMAPVDDPMGMLDETEMDDEDDALLSSLFAESKLAAEDDDDDDDEDDDEDDEGGSEDEDAEDEPAGEGDKESGKKKASRKPRPKKASSGVSRLGGVQKQDVGDVSDLEALWPTAPDVSNVFE